jgi:MerR family mercuric resistance operon transcriptional regulator
VETLTIGGLADAAGVNIETIRYYERRGLLDEPPRSPPGYRQYSPADLWRLRFIGRAKSLGFTLAEITEMVAPAAGAHSAATVLAAARSKLDAVQRQQEELVDLRQRLEQLVELCEGGDPTCTALDVLT